MVHYNPSMPKLGEHFDGDRNERTVNFDQCRAARALLRMSQITLAQRAGANVQVITRFECGSDPRASTVNAIERALVEAGVTLIDDGAVNQSGGPGLRLTYSGDRLANSPKDLGVQDEGSRPAARLRRWLR